jgi:hypothetical protein
VEYPDLSPYTYYAFPLPMRNIGWLGRTHGIPGPALGGADQRLVRAASRRFSQVMLGWHRCEWCPEDTAAQGNGEHHYYAPGGEVYAAPMMLPHYIEHHGYRPPEVFLDALRHTAAPVWDRRAERLATLLTDGSEDLVLRCAGITDLAHWKHPRALEALLCAARDAELADIAGGDVGTSLAEFVACDFAPDLCAEPFPELVRWGLETALGRR